jgi:DNA-binding transcriptional regulator YhcF (GntR family)
VIVADAHSSVPPYEQVRIQLAAQIRHGTLPPGTRLPPVRRLAEELNLAVNTVARAYRELEAAGLVETRGRAGTIVIGRDPTRERVRTAAETYAAVARQFGLSADEALQAVRVALDPSAVSP